jgi:hypothetical protein
MDAKIVLTQPGGGGLVLEGVIPLPDAVAQPPGFVVFSERTLAARWGVSVRTVQRARIARAIAAQALPGGRFQFTLEAVLAYEASIERPAVRQRARR